jgi:hypothetical protein
MELVLATLHLSWLGGATTYLLTVAPQLQRLGHEVTLYSPDAGATEEIARDRGVRVATVESDLPKDCDGVLVQDPVMALELAARYGAPQVFVSHGTVHDMAMPPQLPGLTVAVVAMNDRVAEQARAFAIDAPVVRLRQPIDVERFRFRGPVHERPQKALLLGNHLFGERRSIITSVCEDLGIAWAQVGRHSDTMVTEPADAIAGADLVIGYGRSILEAMACGRPAFVFEHTGVDGWVTPDSYPVLERDGFTGMAFGKQADPDLVRRELAAYEAGTGVVNYHLAWTHHTALDHVQELVAQFRKAADHPPHRTDAGRELARVVRGQWHASWRANELARDLEKAQARLLEAERRFDEIAKSRRWRLVHALMRPLDALRERRRRRRD